MDFRVKPFRRNIWNVVCGERTCRRQFYWRDLFLTNTERFAIIK